MSADKPHFPPDNLPKPILLMNKTHGPMIARWDKVRGCYIATGIQGGFVHGTNAPFVFAQVKEEVLREITGWCFIHDTDFDNGGNAA